MMMMMSVSFFDVAFGAYILGAAALTLILLFGESTMMQGTVVERMHHFITGGCWEMLYDVIGSFFGDRGQTAFESAFTFACGIPHPTLQLFYLSLIGFGYVLAIDTVYHQLNTLATTEQGADAAPLAWRVHFYAVPLVVDAALIAFLVVSFSDPGHIHAGNVRRFLDAYPNDGVLYTKAKACATCHIMRPARSKHCRYCGYCVGRYDHHCGWVNTCIGERNLRYFILFLVLNTVMCMYGFVLAASLLAADLDESAALTQRFKTKSGVVYTLGDSWMSVARWLLIHLSRKFALAVFLFLVTIVAASFTGFQVYLLAINVTTNETFKRLDVQKARLKEKDDKEEEEESMQRGGGGADDARCTSQPRRWTTLCWRPASSTAAPEIPNLYNEGILYNLSEGIAPRSLAVYSLTKRRGR